MRPAPRRPLPPTYFLLAVIATLLLHFLVPGAHWIGSPWRYLGLLSIAAGVALNLWADGLFKRHGTEVKPFMDSRTLVAEGPFRFTRNPMYLGGLLILVGLAVALGSTTPFLITPIVFWLALAHFIRPEERDLERQFGNRYRDYCRQVRRWL
jgi:protein-S-isoprenylcysteine O-methyltransferase Ste14